MTAAHTYSLLLSDAERARYRLMAERASGEEARLWQQAGIRPGARVVDIGCGPGAMLPPLAAAVSPHGSVVGVDADPDAVSAARSIAAGATRSTWMVRKRAPTTPGSRWDPRTS